MPLTIGDLKSSSRVVCQLKALRIYLLKRSEIVGMLDEIEDRNGPAMADHVLAYVRRACRALSLHTRAPARA
jgi:hypothetical protein